MIKVGIIGGSGLDDPQLLSNFKEIEVETPYGKTSSKITAGNLNGVEVFVIARHGKDHSIMPTLVPYQANIWAIKQMGCTHILATTACGSLDDDYRPGNLVFVDQFIDFTKHRNYTLFPDKVVHTAMAEPFCPDLRKILIDTAQELKLEHNSKGTVVTIEGPRFSTRAESLMFKNLGAQVINMSTVPEVVLAREADICYQAIAMVTDYDCWKDGEAPVTWEMIVERMKNNSDNIKKFLISVLPKIK